MRFLIAYVTVTGGSRTSFFAERFVSTFLQFPPKYDFHMLTVCNGGPIATPLGELLHGAIFTRFLPRPNVGGDIGAFIDVARDNQHYDAILCCGESVFFHRSRWLERIAEVWCKHGPGLYGFYASNIIRRHLNTTAFCVSPELLRSWPEKVETKEQRYCFEHGPRPFWLHVQQMGRPVRLVMWDHDIPQSHWRCPPVEDEFWRGDQSQCLMFCSHTDRFQNAVKGTRTLWTRNADFGLARRT